MKAAKEAGKVTFEDALKEWDMTTDSCMCNECGARACVPCDRPWHYGETCSDYQLRIKDKVEEEDKSMLTIQRTTKKCPHCQRNIQKNGGCPHSKLFSYLM